MRGAGEGRGGASALACAHGAPPHTHTHRIDQLARDIVHSSNGPLVALCVLKGGASFYSDLWVAISRLNADVARPVPVQVEFVRLQSYRDDRSTGTVTVSGLDPASLRGRDVLIVEDIVDTGRSAVALMRNVREAGVARVRFATLLHKRTPESNGFIPDCASAIPPPPHACGPTERPALTHVSLCMCLYVSLCARAGVRGGSQSWALASLTRLWWGTVSTTTSTIAT
jgi:hypoxanthine phosphoribosyltransferase